MNLKRNLLLGLLVCAGLFFSVNLASSALFRKARLDLTENGLFTLSDGTPSALGVSSNALGAASNASSFSPEAGAGA